MGQKPPGRSGRFAASLMAGSVALGLSCAQAWSQSGIEPDADKILRAMSTYVGRLKSLSFDYDTDHEIVDRQGQKLQYSASGSAAAVRPDKLMVTRKGPYADVELIVNGKTISLVGKKLNVYAQMESPGTTIDAGVEELRTATGLDAAGADLLAADSYAVLTEGAEQGVVVGEAFVGGVACDHLAFRTPLVDWQIWIEKGDRPVPVKYVVTTKWVTGAPQFAVRMTNWNVDPKLDPAMFDFTPAPGAKKLEQVSADMVGDVTVEIAP